MAFNQIESLLGSALERVRSMHEAVRVVKTRCEQRPEWQSAEHEAEKVQITIEELASVAREVLQANPHSRHYFLTLLRRFGPRLWAEFQETNQHATSEPNWFAEVIKAASALVLQCARTGDAWEWHETEAGRGIYYGDLKESDFVDLSRILALGQLWYEAKVRFRFAAKGLRVFSGAGEPDVLQTQDRSSITRYEERRDLYDSLAGTAGLWYDAVVTPLLRPDCCGWLGTRLLKSHGVLIVVSRCPVTHVPLTYFPMPYSEERVIRDPGIAGDHPSSLWATRRRQIFNSTVPYDRLISESAVAMEASLQIKADELTAFLYAFYAMISDALCLHLIDPKSRDGRIEIVWQDESQETKAKSMAHWKDAGELGLLRSSEDNWVHCLAIWAKQLVERDHTIVGLSESRVRELLHRFMWTEGASLAKNAPLLFLRLSAHTVAVDVLGLPDFLRHLLLQPNLVGRADRSTSDQRVGDLTGAWLEERAFQFFVRNLKLDATSSWLRKKIGNETEIDIAFVFRRILFVIDCKAMAKDAEFMEGQYRKLRNRRTEFRNELMSKLPRRIALISEGKAKPAIDPSLFDRALGMVCTSAVEYLPLSEEVFWSNGSPLVGPPEELLDTIEVLFQQPCP